jgi:outer membrane protein assembly factor BamB
MKTSLTSVIVPAVVAIVGVAALASWTAVIVFDGPTAEFTARVPGTDGTPDPKSIPKAPPPVAGDPIPGDGQPSDVSSTWLGFRGNRRDAICREGPPLARSWPADGPPELWEVEMGEGHAGAAITHGCVYVLDYDEEAEFAKGKRGADTMRCLSLDDGREVWRNSYPAEVTRNHGMSRTVSTLAGEKAEYIVSLGPRFHVACWDAKTGECRWLVDVVGRFGAAELDWYAGQCPLVDGDRVIIATGGSETLMVALDLESGQIVWTCPNPRGWQVTHSSITPMEFAGRSMYVYCGSGGACGVSTDGVLLWDETTWKENFATSPSPVALPDGRIFLSCGYDAIGATILQLKEKGDGLIVETAAQLKRKAFNSEQQTPILYDGYLYAIRKRGEQLVCMDLGGKEQWNSGRQKFGDGPYLIADGMILALSEKGLLVAAEATPKAYRELASFQAIEDAQHAWGPMAIADGRLVLRDATRMKCLDLRKN